LEQAVIIKIIISIIIWILLSLIYAIFWIIFRKGSNMKTDEYYLNICDSIAVESKCLRANVGAIIVKNGNIISSGFNTVPYNREKCTDIGLCYREENNIKSGTQLEKCRAVGSHAECNAISNAAKNGISVKSCTMYIVGHDFVCDMCQAMIINSGIFNVVLRNRADEIIKYFPEIDWNRHSIERELK
jgi:dCMP deaminase